MYTLPCYLWNSPFYLIKNINSDGATPRQNNKYGAGPGCAGTGSEAQVGAGSGWHMRYAELVPEAFLRPAEQRYFCNNKIPSRMTFSYTRYLRKCINSNVDDNYASHYVSVIKQSSVIHFISVKRVRKKSLSKLATHNYLLGIKITRVPFFSTNWSSSTEFTWFTVVRC